MNRGSWKGSLGPEFQDRELILVNMRKEEEKGKMEHIGD